MLIGAIGCNFDEVYDIEAPEENEEDDESGRKPTEQKTEKPTSKPTEKPTSKPTEKPIDDGEIDDEPDEDFDISYIGMFDFGGENLTILMRNFTSSSREWYKNAPEDMIDVAIAAKNEMLEDGLNLNINYQYVPNGYYDDLKANFVNRVVEDVIMDFHEIDISANYGYIGANAAIRDCAANLADEDQFPYFEFDLPCWNQSIIENTFINGRFHYITGDINLSTFDGAMAMWYSKKFYNSIRENGDPKSLQTLALDGDWTYETLYKYAATITPATYGAYGLGITSKNNPNPTDVIPTAWQLNMVVTKGDGTHGFNIIGNDKLEEAQYKYEALFDAPGTMSGASVNSFINGDCLFFTTTVYPSTVEHRMMVEMGAEYELMPWPKFDEFQEKYATTSQDYYTLMSVLDHRHSSIPTKGEAVSAYLQASCEISYLSIRDVYYEHVVGLGGQYVDDTSREIFDLIIDSLVFDFGTVYAPQLNDVIWLWRDAIGSGNTVAQNFYNEQSKFNTAIFETDVWLDLLEWVE
jgi:hypothetical protein